MHQSQKCLIIFTAGYHFPEEVRQEFAKIKETLERLCFTEASN